MHVPEDAPADLFITEALDRRPSLAVDYRRESLAMQELAAHMADDPDDVLPRFVDIALAITGAVSGGLSLYEPTPSPVFRWHYLRGTLAEFNGATTPRNFSPCGITLDRNGPVLTLHPERVYGWLVDADVVLPEVLLVPLYLGSTEPSGTLWVVSEAEGHFTRDHARVLGELAAFVGIAVRMRKREQDLRRDLAEQSVLTKEMSHRVRNVFAITDGMIRISAKNAADKTEMAVSLSGRLHALASAHSLVSRNLHEDEDAARGSIDALIREVVAPYERELAAPGSRFELEGPMIYCGDHGMTGLALVFHELATNAAKYGALRSEQGVVRIAWQEASGFVTLTWTESGGPTVTEPSKTNGFGSVLVRTTVKGQFGGSVAYAWNSGGLNVSLLLMSERLAA